jgi:RNA polymerase sigma-70 factor (ECF subfamily)
MLERFIAAAARDGATQDFLRYVQHGDLTLLEELLRTHSSGCYRQAQRFLGNASDAEDAVQEACLQLVRSAKRFDGSVPFGPWLGRLVHLSCLRALRSRGRHRHERPAMTEMLSAPAEPQEDPEQVEALRQAVARLPERYRAPISLHYFAQMDLASTALAMGLSANAVAVRLHRAREVLRNRLRGSQPQLTNLGVASALSAIPVLPASHAVGAGVGTLIGLLASGAPVPATAIKLGILHQGILTMSSHPILTALFAGMLVTGVAVPIALHAEEQPKPAPVATSSSPGPRINILLDPWQSPDGSWDDGFGAPPGAITHPNRGNATAFALLSYIGAGYSQATPSSHQHAIAQGVAWLLQAQQADGSFGGSVWSDAALTTALNEFFSMTSDPRLKDPSRRAVAALIRRRVQVGKQMPLMAWAEADGRVSSRTNALCIIALKSAMAAQADLASQPLLDARAWLDAVWSNTNSRWLDPTAGIGGFPASVDFSVDPPIASGSDPASALAVAAFVKEPKASMLITSLKNAILAQVLPPDRALDYTTLWMQSLGLFQCLDNASWNSWSDLVRHRLGSVKQKSGPLAGGWTAVPDQGEPVLGNVTSTATALLIEQIFIRFDIIQNRHPADY